MSTYAARLLLQGSHTTHCITSVGLSIHLLQLKNSIL